MKRACPRLQCGKCLEKGHSQRECSNELKCRRCYQEGHMAKYCPKKDNLKKSAPQVTEEVQPEAQSTPVSTIATLTPQSSLIQDGTPETEATPTREEVKAPEPAKKPHGRSTRTHGRTVTEKLKRESFVFPGSPTTVQEPELRDLMTTERRLKDCRFVKEGENKIHINDLPSSLVRKLEELGLRVRDGYLCHPQGFLSRQKRC